MKIGMMELVVILLVAFFVLGPEKTVAYSRKIGKALRTLRIYINSFTDDIRETVTEPLSELAEPVREAMEPIGDLTKPLQDVTKAVQQPVELSGVFFFLVGAAFCIWIVLPFMLQFFLSLNTIEVAGLYSVKEYMSYLYGVITAFGIIFEIPVTASILALIGILKPELMVKGRRLVIVICFIVGAAITPTDVLSQLLVAVPMIVLYEVSILLVRLIAKGRSLRDPEAVEQEEARKERMRRERTSRWKRAAAQAERRKAK